MIKGFQVALNFQNRFLRIRDKFYFSKQASFIIITFHQFQILSFILSKEIINELQLQGSDTLDFLAKIFSFFRYAFHYYRRIYTLFAREDSCNESILTIIMFILMCAYIVLLLIIVCDGQQANGKLYSKMINAIEEIVSFAFKSYYFIFHWSLTLSALVLMKRKFQSEDLNLCSEIGFFFSIPTLILSFLLLVNVLTFSFTYHFKHSDYLYGEDNYLKHYQVLAIYVILILYVFVENEIVIWIGLLSTLLNIFAQTYFIQFRDQFMANWNKILLSETASLLILVILVKIFDLSKNFNAIFIMALPLTYALQMKLIFKQDQIFYLMKKNNLIGNHLDKMLRSIYYMKKNLKTNKSAFQNIQLYSIMTNHLANCKLENNQISYKKSLSHQLCFCLKYFPNQNENENPHWKRLIKQHSDGIHIENDKHTITDEKEFKKFIFDFIKSQYETQIDPKNKELYFSYITFLFEVFNQPTKGFYEALKLKLSSTGFKNSAIISDLINKSRAKFNLLILKEELKNQKFDMISVLKFEKNIKQRETDLLNLVIKYQQWYQALVNQSVNLNRLQTLGTKILEEILNLENEIHQMFQQNPNSTPLGQIIKVFYKFVNFNKLKPEFLRRKNLNLFKYNHSLLKELFDAQSFIIQITLMQPRGTIINCSKDLYKFTGLQDKEILNQNIKMVIPDIIAQYHDSYLDTFVETGRMNVVKADNRVLYIKNKDMFIVPVTARVRLENYTNNDFGASALLNKINAQYYYLMLNKFGMLEEFCEKIFKHILSKYFNLHQKQLKGLDLLRILPYLYTLWDQLTASDDLQDYMQRTQFNQLNELQDDYIVLPKDSADVTIFFENRKSQQFVQFKKNNHKLSRNQMKQYLQRCIGEPTIYEVKYKIKIIHAINQNIIVLEIQHLKPVKQKQLTTIMNRILRMIDIDISSPSNESIQPQKKGIQDSSFFLKSVDQEHDLDEDFIMEIDTMIQNKQSNLDLYLKQSAASQYRQETIITSLVRQEFSECLLPAESNTFVQLPNADRFNQIEQLNNASHDQPKSAEEESNSMDNKDEELLKVDACSISSSKNSDDLQTKKQTINEVLNSNQTTHSIVISKSIILFVLMLCVCYSINFVLFFDDKKQYEQNLIFYNSSAFIDVSFQNYIISHNDTISQQQQIIAFKQNMETLLYTNLQSFEFQDIQLYDGFYELKYILFLMIQNDSTFYQYIIDNYFKIGKAFESQLELQSKQQVDNEHKNQDRYIYILICTLSLLGLALIVTLPTCFVLTQQKLMILKFFIRLDQTSITKSLDMFNLLYDQLRFQQNHNFDYNSETLNIKSIYKTMKNSAHIGQEKIKAIKAKSYTYENNSYITIFVSVIVIFFFVSLSAYLIISHLLKNVMIKEVDQIESYLQEIIEINHYLLNNQQFFTILKLHPQPMYDKYFPFENASSISDAKYKISNLSLGSFSQNISIILEENACLGFQKYDQLQEECVGLDMNYGLIQLIIGYMNQQDIFLSQIETADNFKQFNDLAQNNNVIDQIHSQINLTNLIMNQICVDLQEQIIQKFNNQMVIEIIIYILGILFIILFSLFIQKTFKSLLLSQIRECQNLLRLVPFDVICNNAQIMSYITRRARQIKQ